MLYRFQDWTALIKMQFGRDIRALFESIASNCTPIIVNRTCHDLYKVMMLTWSDLICCIVYISGGIHYFSLFVFGNDPGRYVVFALADEVRDDVIIRMRLILSWSAHLADHFPVWKDHWSILHQLKSTLNYSNSITKWLNFELKFVLYQLVGDIKGQRSKVMCTTRRLVTNLGLLHWIIHETVNMGVISLSPSVWPTWYKCEIMINLYTPARVCVHELLWLDVVKL